tara:strand:- start:872 stop:2098 length:1227 start_codon:yes stop_codon:yes gene_type:complete
LKFLSKWTVILFFLIFSACEKKDKQNQISLSQKELASKGVNFLNISKNLLKIKQFEQSLLMIDSAEIFIPNYIGVHFLRAKVFDELKMFDLSKESYEKVLTINSKYPGANFNLGNNALIVSKFEEALNYFNKELDVNETPKTWVSIAIVHTNLYQPDSAEFALKKALRLDDKYSKALILLGQFYKDSGEIDEAINFTRKALDLEPQNIDYQYFYGSLLFQNSDFKLALPFLQNVVKQKPWDYWAYNNLAQTLIRTGKKAEGEIMLILSDSLENKNSIIDLAKNQAQSNPYNVVNWIKLGDDLRSVGRKNEALDAYKSALFVDPKNEFLTENVALFALDLKDTISGVHLLEKVVSLNDKNANVWFNLGIIYAHQSKYVQSKNALEKSLELKPDDKTIIQHLNQVKEWVN